MAAKRRGKSLKVGDRVRDKLNGRDGKITDVTDDGSQPHYAVAYDEAPQDHFLTTPAKDGAERVRAQLEPERPQERGPAR
jgi:hypothetical protein